MPIDFSTRTWPQRDRERMSKPEAGLLAGSASRTFVSEGALTVKAIDFGGQMRAIPRECSAITALGLADGVVYGATSGEQSWLFQYALRSYCEAAIPLGAVPGCTQVGAVVVRPGGGALLAGGDEREHRLIRVSGLHLPGDVIQEWGVPSPRYEDLAVPVPGERIACLQASADGTRLVGLSEPSGVLFWVSTHDGTVTVVGEVDPVGFFGRTLVEDGDGTWYAFGTLGRLLCYDPSTETIEPTGVQVPCFPGRGPYARVTAAVLDDTERWLFVGDTEGLFSVVLLEEERVLTLGKPIPLGGVDHLVRIGDGRIYGIAGSREGMAHLFSHDPREGSLRDLGVCCATTEKAWYGYRFGALLATPEGRLIMGEDDHLGCVFSYFPPV